jgi:hypothetical protein
MNRSGKLEPDRLPEHESGVRRMTSDAQGEPYVAFESLEAARAAPEGVVVLEGDYGGQIYMVVPARLVRCRDEDLQALLLMLDSHAWKDPAGARVYYERRPLGAGVGGGMGGGRVMDGVWLHPDLRALETAVAAVVQGKRGARGRAS